PAPRRHLAERSSLPEISRYELDERAVPELSAPRDRFRRLPLPGDGVHRGCNEYRSRLQVLAPSRRLRRARRERNRRPNTPALRLSAGGRRVKKHRREVSPGNSWPTEEFDHRSIDGAAFCSRGVQKKNAILGDLSYECGVSVKLLR